MMVDPHFERNEVVHPWALCYTFRPEDRDRSNLPLTCLLAGGVGFVDGEVD